MTYEEMLAVAEKVTEALRSAGFDSPEVLKEEAVPGNPIPMVFGHDGDDFSLELNLL